MTVLRATCPVHGVVYTSNIPWLGMPLGVERCWMHESEETIASAVEGEHAATAVQVCGLLLSVAEVEE